MKNSNQNENVSRRNFLSPANSQINHFSQAIEAQLEPFLKFPYFSPTAPKHNTTF
jgi:hypothetical protein